MKIVDCGSGTPVVLIPGIQGRWEWMRPAVEALAARCRVITFSLADEPTAGSEPGEDEGFWRYVRQVADALDAAGLASAAVCGVSYGGLIAAAFAARYPDRVSALILVSPIPPAWQPNARVRFYTRAPRLLAPLFMLASVRMYPEIAAAHATVSSGLAAGARHAVNVLGHMFSPSRMAGRVHMLASVDLTGELSRLDVRTLVITGEETLDRVVAPALSREYLRLWPHAALAVLPRTGHLGLITRAGAFAELVCGFAQAHPSVGDAAGMRRQRLG